MNRATKWFYWWGENGYRWYIPPRWLVFLGLSFASWVYVGGGFIAGPHGVVVVAAFLTLAGMLVRCVWRILTKLWRLIAKSP